MDSAENTSMCSIVEVMPLHDDDVISRKRAMEVGASGQLVGRHTCACCAMPLFGSRQQFIVLVFGMRRIYKNNGLIFEDTLKSCPRVFCHNKFFCALGKVQASHSNNDVNGFIYVLHGIMPQTQSTSCTRCYLKTQHLLG